jgi:hypothetical protein
MMSLTSHINKPIAHAKIFPLSQWTSGGSAHSAAFMKCSGYSPTGAERVQFKGATEAANCKFSQSPNSTGLMTYSHALTVNWKDSPKSGGATKLKLSMTVLYTADGIYTYELRSFARSTTLSIRIIRSYDIIFQITWKSVKHGAVTVQAHNKWTNTHMKEKIKQRESCDEAVTHVGFKLSGICVSHLLTVKIQPPGCDGRRMRSETSALSSDKYIPGMHYTYTISASSVNAGLIVWVQSRKVQSLVLQHVNETSGGSHIMIVAVQKIYYF